MKNSNILKKQYYVESIVGKKWDEQTNQYLYEVKWDGYQNDDNTWEPIEHLENVRHMVREFEEQVEYQKIDQSRFKALVKQQLISFIELHRPKLQQKEISFSELDEYDLSSPQDTQDNQTIKSHVLTQGLLWCQQNYESNIDY